MDELIHHCLRELSFDGDLGCDVGRLQDFVAGFYAREDAAQQQTADDAYCAFVWSVIVQQPGVRVGVVPPGAGGEVYIAPQASAQRKAKSKKEEVEEDRGPESTFNVVEDAAIRSLVELRQEHGDTLRIAVDPEISVAAITGSHIRPSKLTPMVYTALQFITRNREQGISVVDLSKKSGYDPKTCFYLIKQLLELDLIVKRRRPGVSTNFCVHKYFFDHSPVWQQVLKEEAEAENKEKGKDVEPDGEEEEGQESFSLASVHFDPIDSRHLSSLPLVRARITKLLKASPHHLHAYQNLLVKIGFATPTRTDRRFFQSRLRELAQQGVVEKVQVPHANQQKHAGKKVTCLRLLSAEDQVEASEGIRLVSVPEGEEAVSEEGRLKMNLTLHKQIINLLDDAGTSGMTLSDLGSALDNFDKRTIELLLARLEKDPPPSHISDLGVAQLGETHGRERRYKYYTLAHYRTIAAKEKLDDPRYLDTLSNTVGGFLPVDASQFYEDTKTLLDYVDDFPFGQDGMVGGKSVAKWKAKGKGKTKNPILADGTVKKGRPRKSVATEEGDEGVNPKRGTKRKRTEETSTPATGEAGVEAEEPPPKKKRGRPPKVRPEQTDVQGSDGDIAEKALSEVAPPKKRGRPPKKTTVTADSEQGTNPGPPTSAQPTSAKRRGRPPKIPRASISKALEVITPERDASPPAQEVISRHSTKGAELSIQPSSDDVPRHEGAVQTDATGTFSNTSLRRSSRRPNTYFSEGEELGIQPAQGADSSDGMINSPSALIGHRVGVHGANGDSRRLVDLLREINAQPMDGEQPGSSSAEPSFSSSLPDGHKTPAATGFSLSYVPIDPSLVPENDEVSHATAPAPPRSELVLLDADASITEEGIGTKRSHADTNVAQPSGKRAKLDEQPNASGKGRWKTNISQSRREKEFMQILSDAGGIINFTSKEFYESHAALIESLHDAGELSSTRPGARLDKRTAQATLEDLESRGKIKSISTAIPTSTGGSRLVRIIYLPDIAEADLQSFLENYSFQQSVPQTIKVLDEPLAYGGGGKRSSRPAPAGPSVVLDSRKHHNKDHDIAQQMLENDDQGIREALLTEKNTVAQLHGFIVGKVARARELHLSTVRLFEPGQPSIHVVSTEDRILQTSYYWEELPVSTFCSVVSCLVNGDNLHNLLQTAEGRQTPVGQLPSEVCHSLQLGRWRSRARILDLLDILRCLDLVVPLQVSTSGVPAISCISKDGSTHAFDIAPGRTWTLTTAPSHWKFNTVAALHLWGLPDNSPPFWKDITLSNVAECTEYWEALVGVSLDVEHAKDIVCLDPRRSIAIEPPAIVTPTAQCLRRSSSWSSIYQLSWYQSEYLRQFVDKTTANTPLDDDDGGEARLAHISWVASAPKEALVHFFERTRKKHLHVSDLTQKRAKRRTGAENVSKKSKNDDLAQKAADAKQQRERDWDDMISHVQSDLLDGSAAVRVRRVKARFLQSSGKNRGKWEAEIAQAIQEASLVARKLISSNIMPILTPLRTHALASNQSEKSVEDLIAQQGPRLAAPSTKKKNKEPKDEDETSGVGERLRRQRFQWNRDYDELARDATTIIKSRCRGTRIEWAALEQIFPAVPKNSVRQRLVSLKEAPGAEAYLARLENKWNELWVQHRGSAILPDPDPASPTNFDLLTHIKFLRAHVDKNALRVGYIEHVNNSKMVLPPSVEDIAEVWEVVDKRGSAPSWDFMWTLSAEEGREKQMTQQSFFLENDDVSITRIYSEDTMYVAESALKMAMGAPNETYDSEVATQLLHSVGEERVQAATSNLLSRGILSKIIRDPQKSKPGRMLKISESNQNAISGSMSSDIFQDAVAIEDLSTQNEDIEAWREWSLFATDGDTAALLELVSENKVDFRIDTVQAQAARIGLDWNSKKAADDDIETAIQIRLIQHSDETLQASLSTMDTMMAEGLPATSIADTASHGLTIDDLPAHCRRASVGIVNCAACLGSSTSAFLATCDQEMAMSVHQVLTALSDAAANGLTKEALSAVLGGSERARIWDIVDSLTAASVPLAHWTGYSSVVLVSSAFIQPWTVTLTLPDKSSKMILPRRWADICGRTMSDVWKAALQAVIGIILFRPGISQSEIYWRLRSVYDRQEVNEILQHIVDVGLAHKRRQPGEIAHCSAGPPDNDESRAMFWFVGNARRWYQL